VTFPHAKLRRMRTLVTGGAGFIGSNIVRALLERENEVLVLDDLSTGRRENLAAEAALIEADVADADAVEAAVAAHASETIFHLAAQIDVRHSVADPAHDARVNVEGTINVLEAARRHGSRVVFSSTGGAVYGEADIIPTPEDAPRRPLAPYGQSKSAAEDYCALYQRLHGVDVVCLRYANVYGPHQDPLGEAGVVAIFCERAARGEPATVFGDGGQTRDFVFVDDVVQANLIAMGHDAGGVFNIGRGEETTVLELAEMLGLVVEHAPERSGEVLRSCIDSSLARQALPWAPQVGLEEGIERTLEWVRAGMAADRP
jgi:UDP-glucose 4-epimerase